MADPHTLPTWRYYEGGRSVVVQTPAEYAALEPGHADNPSGPFPPEEDEPTAPQRADPRQEQARALREAGHTQREIAEALGVSPTTVRRWLDVPAPEE